jgi:hypothetical protein
MDTYASNRAAHLAMARHAAQHKDCPGFDRGRYHRDVDYRCPHCEGNTAPPVRSQWRAMAQQAATARRTAGAYPETGATAPRGDDDDLSHAPH